MKQISVITVSLNAKEALEKTILALNAQTLRAEVEYIVIDGASSDGSQELISQYKNYVDIVKIENDDGIFDAMNKGIELATGVYTYFLNAGDVFSSSDVLTVVNRAMEVSVVDHNIVCGKVRLMNEEKFVSIAALSRYIPHQGAFVKTTLLKKYKFDDSFKIYGDLDLWTRMEKGGDYSVLTLDEVIADFELGGIGNNPAHLYIQYKDRQKYFLKHKIYSKWLVSGLVFLILQSCYILLGKERYFVFKTQLTSFKRKVLGALNSFRQA
ncbi:MAG: glycosyltransferase family 2 protein [Cyanobacteria bacterium P01_C01_bin.121]